MLVEFYECSSLQDINIPLTVKKIETLAFWECTSLNSIHVHYMDLNEIDFENRIFEDIDFETCTLYIPSGTRWAYRHHPVFSQFKNIVTERQK